MMHLKKMMSRCRETWIKATHSMWTRTDFLEYVFFFCLDCVTLSQHMRRQEAARGEQDGGKSAGSGIKRRRRRRRRARARTHTHTHTHYLSGPKGQAALRVQSAGAALSQRLESAVPGALACPLRGLCSRKHRVCFVI